MFSNIILEQFQEIIKKFGSKNAFHINGKFYDYNSFVNCISKVRKSIHINTTSAEKNIGLIINDDIET